MKDIRKFEEYGRSLAERVAQGKFNKEKVEKTIRSKAKKATSFMPYQNYYSEYALKAFNERFAEITGKPAAAGKGVDEEVQRYFPEGLSKAQPGSEPPMADSPFEVLPDDEPGFEYSDIEIHTLPMGNRFRPARNTLAARFPSRQKFPIRPVTGRSQNGLSVATASRVIRLMPSWQE